MRNKLLRSMLAVAFSTVVAIGALSGLSGAKRDAAGDTTWGVAPRTVAMSDGSTGTAHSYGVDDTTWG
ncbi:MULTISPECIES: hypothetical protein [Streptomyces]|uniref:Uncharacterized protein n=1 Tax=Streptomyces canarius TaxID=285453 RepID=A0ABQ3CWE5_9ACTN|nr:hypothetical protein [Streptomyces canarius]GHA47222.1 hypothetical protein GCM10010345_59670 [Streptomyces canarius]